MKLVYAAAFALAATVPAASAQGGDPKVEFLGYCIEQGNSTSYCACLTDEFAKVLNAKDFKIYLDYLKIIAGGERDQTKIIDKLKADNGVTGKELGASLKTSTESAATASKTCAGL
jgi:hypothetical protein